MQSALGYLSLSATRVEQIRPTTPGGGTHMYNAKARHPRAGAAAGVAILVLWLAALAASMAG